MKKSKEETARTRARILASASQRFREEGFASVSVKDLMSEAGLTHGGFYAHFPSKEALVGAACEEALWETANQLPETPDARALETFLDRYVSDLHVAHPAKGCPIPVLAAEATRQGGEVQEAFANGIATLIDRMAVQLPRERAIPLLAEIVGAMVLARATTGDLREEILKTVRQDLP